MSDQDGPNVVGKEANLEVSTQASTINDNDDTVGILQGENEVLPSSSKPFSS
jgi:hypothetical protein